MGNLNVNQQDALSHLISVTPNNSYFGSLSPFKKGPQANTTPSSTLKQHFNARKMDSSEKLYRLFQVDSFNQAIQKANIDDLKKWFPLEFQNNQNKNDKQIAQEIKSNVEQRYQKIKKELPNLKTNAQGELLPNAKDPNQLPKGYTDWNTYLGNELKTIGLVHSAHSQMSVYSQITHSYNFSSMLQALKIKADADDNFRDYLATCANHGILPVEISQYDAFWGAGADGSGKNNLGILQYILGLQILKENNIIPQKTLLPNSINIHNLGQSHDHLSKEYQKMIGDRNNQHKLSHNQAVKLTNHQPASASTSTPTVAKNITLQANQTISKNTEKLLSTQENSLISSKGRLGVSYKFAFKTQEDAEKLMNQLESLGIDKNDLTCHGITGKEQYPMGEHKFIVRIEKNIEKHLGILLNQSFDQQKATNLINQAYTQAEPPAKTTPTDPPTRFAQPPMPSNNKNNLPAFR